MAGKIKRKRISDQVLEHLKELIVENSLHPGDTLPSETSLAEELGVGRPAVREALRMMEGFGIVQSRPKIGTRLKPMTMRPVTDYLHFWVDVEGVRLSEMGRARRILECAILPEVIEKADENDYARLEATIEQARALHAQGASIAPADLEFHLALLAATKNRALEGFGIVLHEFFAHFRGRAIAVIGLVTEAQDIEDHTQIVQALRNKNSETAIKIMQAHLKLYEDLDSLMPQQQPKST